MPRTPNTICPVCELPVGNDPHEACLEQVQQEEPVHEAPPMPCPGCGQAMESFECVNPTCELYSDGV